MRTRHCNGEAAQQRRERVKTSSSEETTSEIRNEIRHIGATFGVMTDIENPIEVAYFIEKWSPKVMLLIILASVLKN